MGTLLLAGFVVVVAAVSVFAAPPKVSEKYRPIDWDPAPLPAAEVRRDRPRIWFTRAQVPELRKRCQTTFWRIEIEPTQPATDDVFLTLLDTAAADVVSPPSGATIKRDGQAVGAQICRAAQITTVLFYPDGRLHIDGEPIGPAYPALKPYEEP